MSKKDKANPDNSDIIYENKSLFLNCPKCKNIPYLSFNLSNSEKIKIKCDQCHNNSEISLNTYLKDLPSKIPLSIKKCEKHSNFLDEYCYKCHIQFCSKCEEENKKHQSHKIKIILKIINSEKINQIKATIEKLKKYFKNYINAFMKEYFNKFPNNQHYSINNTLIKPYINDMKNFFLFCDNVLLNYDVDYPDYYQQTNLKNLIDVLNEKTVLKDLKERKLERLFKYNNNNFIINKKNVVDNLLLSVDFKEEIIESLLINNEFIFICFKNCLKLYNYKNKIFIYN